nr:hypothetical protein [Tanacetum cinerariifolium]
MTQEAINNFIAQRVTEALAEYETQKNSVVNRDTSNTTGTGPRTVHPTRECTYKDYLNYGPLKFNGIEGVIGLTRCDLTWWNSHMRAVSQEVAYAMPWKTLKQMMTAKMFPKESDEIERYVGGLPEMIRGNVMSYEPKSMQKAIEFANDQMDQKLLGIVDRQANNKRKFDKTSRNQQNQQPFRRNNNVARAYAAGSRAANTNNNNNNNNNYNNQRATTAYQGVPTCFKCGAQGGNPDANVVTDKSEEKRLEDVPVVRDFSEVFPEDLPGWEWKCGGKSIWTGYWRRKPKRQCRDGYCNTLNFKRHLAEGSIGVIP